ncbi:MAG: Rod shape-determining protein MreD [Cyclobacteriaceae bacterium]|nr:Rod shape-determining protein MreD [Cyclobacteriaceae bacterium]
MNRDNLLRIATFFTYVLFQVLLFNKMVLWSKGFAFIYVGYLLTFPIELGVIPAMLIGFATGVSVDIFSNTLGVHASASVLLMYIRPYLLNLLTPHGGYPLGASPKPSVLGFSWFSTYSIILILIHHLVLFFVEAGGFHLFFFTIQKVVLSTLFTFSVVILIQYLFARKKDTR